MCCVPHLGQTNPSAKPDQYVAEQLVNVLHLINTLAVGGAELHLLTLTKHLSQLGVTNVVACLRENVGDSRSLRAEFEQQGIKVINLHAESRWNATYPLKVISLIRTQSPDVFHTHLPRAHLAGYVVAKLGHSVPWVSSVHNVYGNSWSGDWTLPVFTYVWRKPQAVIAISEAVKDWLTLRRRIPEDKISVVYYGIEGDRFKKHVGDFRSAWGLDNRFVIGSIGRLEPRKGHNVLISAMPSILSRVPNARLVIAGHDPWGYGQQLRSAIKDLHLSDYVELVGFQPNIPSFLNTIDVFAFASHAEGFGQVLVEAMSAGKPVVASDIAPINEIVLDGSTGLLSPVTPDDFADNVVALAKNETLRQDLGRAAADRARTGFAADRMARETLDVYNAVLNSHT